MIGRTIGRYRVESKLGQGGMASVWKAEDTLLGRPVALKILSEPLASSPDQRRRFLREAKAAATLDHPAAAAVYDAGEHDGLLYIAFACIDGETVSDLAIRGPLAVERVATIGAAVADALDHAHRLGILHRDVTGRNVMLARDGRTFVLDFGLAHAAESSRLTNSGVTLGTLAYLAPEVAMGGSADGRSDLYGLGVVLYEALAGSLPFADAPPGALIYATVHQVPVRPGERRADGDTRLDSVVMRLLEKLPAERFASGQEVREAIRRALLEPAPAPGARSASHSQATPSSGGSASTQRRRRDDRPDADHLPHNIYLAVLPFEDLGSHEDVGERRDVFARGVAQALKAALANLDAVHLVSTADVPGEMPDPPRAWAQRVGANLVIQGSVRRAGNQLRISYTLLNATSGLQVHGDTLDGSAHDLFELEDRLVRSVMRSLGLEDTRDGSRHVKAPHDPAAHEHYVQALGYLQRHDHEAHIDAAIALLERLLSTEDRSASIHAALGRAYLLKYRLTSHAVWESKAAEHGAIAMTLDSVSPDVLITLGDLSVSVGRHREAVAAYEQALRLKPGAVEALIGMARAYEGGGQFEEAIAACRQAIALNPEFWASYNQLGFLYYGRGRYQEALESWQRIVTLTPDNDRAYTNIATAEFQLDHIPEAIAALQRSLAIRPTATAFSNLGGTYFYAGRYDEAASAFERAVALQPHEPLWWGNLGSACMWIPDRRSRAIEALDRAVEGVRERLARNSKHARNWSYLASWLANRGESAEARDAIERALDLAPDDAPVLVTAGEVYEQIGDRDAALRHLRQATQQGYGWSRLLRDPYLASLREDARFESIRPSPVGGSSGGAGC